MTVAGVVRRWNAFFFDATSPLPVALYRICYGILHILNLWLLSPGWLAYYGPHGIVSIKTAVTQDPGAQFSVLTHLPDSALLVNVFFWVMIGLAVLVTIGFMTRLSTIALYLCFMSLQMRNIQHPERRRQPAARLRLLSHVRARRRCAVRGPVAPDLARHRRHRRPGIPARGRSA